MTFVRCAKGVLWRVESGPAAAKGGKHRPLRRREAEERQPSPVESEGAERLGARYARGGDKLLLLVLTEERHMQTSRGCPRRPGYDLWQASSSSVAIPRWEGAGCAD